MNAAYRTMLDHLALLRDEYGVEGLKAEYEAEASRLEEVLRLKDLCMRSGLTLTLKIGGALAVRDIVEAKAIGVDNLVGPMIESAHALALFMAGVDRVFGPAGQRGTAILFNVETIRTIESLGVLYGSDAFAACDGIVLGRGDLVESMGHPRNAVDSDACFAQAAKAIRAAKELEKTTVMGGSVTAATVGFVRRLGTGVLDRYETRKVCFATIDALARDPEKGIGLALDFELMWMESKRAYYRTLSEEDDARILSLQKRKAG